MLISFRVNNCFIYNDEIEFSMRADMRYKRFSSNVSVSGKTKVLKAAMIIGPNNSGKTNFIRCLKALKNILLNSKSMMKSNLFSDRSLCELSVTFLENKKEYLFEAKYDTLSKEYVFERFAEITYDKYHNKKETDVIVRDFIQQNFYCKDETVHQAMKITAKNNILIYLLDVKQFPILGEVKKIITSFASKLDIVDMNNIPIKKTIDMLKTPGQYKEKIVNFIRNADLSLEDYRYLTDDEIKISFRNTDDEEISPQENALKLPETLVEMLHLSSVYKGKAVPSYLFDSTGTKKIAALASYVIDALENGRILIVDELDNSLHFKLTRAIITLFNNELNKNAQLICTVHDVSLLDCQKLFRKEQIWFSHKDSEKAYLYSLSEFTSEKDKVRDTTDLIEKYRSGVFGALPEPDLFESLLEVQSNV